MGVTGVLGKKSKGEGCSGRKKGQGHQMCISLGGRKECVGATQETKNYREVILLKQARWSMGLLQPWRSGVNEFDIECPGGCIQIQDYDGVSRTENFSTIRCKE